MSRTAITRSDGSYQFSGLPAGTYQLAESQPNAMNDGQDSTEISGAVAGADQITNIVLSGESVGACNFGEAGLKPVHVSVRFYLASTPAPDEYLPELIARAEEAAGNTALAAAIRAGQTTLDNANAPVAVADSYSVAAGTTLTVTAATGVLANDTDADGNTLTATLVGNTSSGTLTLNSDGSFTYTPESGFQGSDTFTYTAHDGLVDSAAAAVTINVDAAETQYSALADQALQETGDWLI